MNHDDFHGFKPKPKRTAEEQELLDYMTKDLGRELTEQEANLYIAQARTLGVID